MIKVQNLKVILLNY